MNKTIPRHILPVIVFAQFAGTSLWFAGNAIIPDLVQELQLNEMAVGYITSSVQLGFIIGTLLFAFLSIADRISPSKVFLGCAVLGAAANSLSAFTETFSLLLVTRFATGFFLAGIYPVGMKIASDWHKEGLGKALGYLVGALVLGKAFPFFINYAVVDLGWSTVLFATSWFSALGGIILYLAVPEGPYQSKRGKFEPTAMFRLFKNSNFRSASFGYFGHMWELYTFWAFVPVMLAYFLESRETVDINISMLTFLIIGIGGLSCAFGGYISQKISSKKIAQLSLIISCLCCVCIPLFFQMPFFMFLGLLFVWGIFVIPDSPQFSTLVARSSDQRYVATGLTIVNSIGFAITIISIQIINILWATWQSPLIFMVMALGPIAGLWSISKYKVDSEA